MQMKWMTPSWLCPERCPKTMGRKSVKATGVISPAAMTKSRAADLAASADMAGDRHIAIGDLPHPA
jgi:hypothetical protein